MQSQSMAVGSLQNNNNFAALDVEIVVSNSNMHQWFQGTANARVSKAI
jgi:hypothetical protein